MANKLFGRRGAPAGSVKAEHDNGADTDRSFDIDNVLPASPATRPSRFDRVGETAVSGTRSIPAPPPSSLTAAAPPPVAATKPDMPRRAIDIPGTSARRLSADVLGNLPLPGATSPIGNGLHGDRQAKMDNETDRKMRKLIVGREISLSGEISACDMLVVEGLVEATLRDGRLIEIAESGFFKGTVEIDEADLAGRFEGHLRVRGRMKVRSTGRIHGTIRYGELEVEAGGQLVGDVQVGTNDTVAEERPTQTAPAKSIQVIPATGDASQSAASSFLQPAQPEGGE